jgi:hypothetical protein
LLVWSFYIVGSFCKHVSPTRPSDRQAALLQAVAFGIITDLYRTSRYPPFEYARFGGSSLEIHQASFQLASQVSDTFLTLSRGSWVSSWPRGSSSLAFLQIKAVGGQLAAELTSLSLVDHDVALFFRVAILVNELRNGFPVLSRVSSSVPIIFNRSTAISFALIDFPLDNRPYRTT